MKKSLFIFLLCLTSVNIIQSYSTELLYDEAYYWTYSKFLNWGYFDHPPLVAIYIFFSNFFFSEELGVRFISSILFSFSIYILWKLIKSHYSISNKKNIEIFLSIIVSNVFLNLYGFVTTPDTPLVLFIIIFLYAYKKIIVNNNWKYYFLFAIATAGLLYSKYVGVLIVFFTILSNIKLLKNNRFWISIGISFAMYLPHLYWQFINDFPSVKYHLYERFSKNTKYHLQNTLLYFLNQIGFFGFTFPLVYIALFKNLKNKDFFEKCLNFIVIGFLIFFLPVTFIGHVQIQWTFIITIPLILITFSFLKKHKNYRKTFYALTVANLIVTVIIRILLANESISPVVLETHKNKEWVTALKKEAKGRRIIFLNSYTNPSVYWFYSKDTTSSINEYYSRKNQFNLLNIDDSFEKEKILIESSENKNPSLKFNNDFKRNFYFNKIDSYKPIRSLEYQVIGKKPIKFNKSSTNKIPIRIINPYNRDISLKNIKTIIFLKEENTTHKLLATYKKVDFIKAKSSTICVLEFTVSKTIKEREAFLDIYVTNTDKIPLQKVTKSIIKIKY